MKRTRLFGRGASGLMILIAALGIVIPQETWAENAKPVLVTNPITQPVPTDVVNTSANPVPVLHAPPEPFQKKADIPLSPGVSGGEVAIGVPPGKQLVLEHISILLLLPTGQTAWARVLVPIGGGDYLGHMIILTPTGCCSPAQKYFVGSQPMRLYTDQLLLFDVAKDSDAGSGIANVTVTGYLLDKP
jgi:hypothetical protein